MWMLYYFQFLRVSIFFDSDFRLGSFWVDEAYLKTSSTLLIGKKTEGVKAFQIDSNTHNCLKCFWVKTNVFFWFYHCKTRTRITILISKLDLKNFMLGLKKRTLKGLYYKITLKGMMLSPTIALLWRFRRVSGRTRAHTAGFSPSLPSPSPPPWVSPLIPLCSSK